MGLPKISIAVVPMTKKLPNMMNLPIISGFISKSIDAACAEYVAPKSLTLDLQQLISGDDIKKGESRLGSGCLDAHELVDTESIGVVVLHIHRAIGIKSMDTMSTSGRPSLHTTTLPLLHVHHPPQIFFAIILPRFPMIITTTHSTDSTDPYITVAYTRQGKPLYSTRIIKGELNPVFEETAVITVDANAIRIGERISLQLWDSDRRSAVSFNFSWDVESHDSGDFERMI